MVTVAQQTNNSVWLTAMFERKQRSKKEDLCALLSLPTNSATTDFSKRLVTTAWLPHRVHPECTNTRKSSVTRLDQKGIHEPHKAPQAPLEPLRIRATRSRSADPATLPLPYIRHSVNPDVETGVKMRGRSDSHHWFNKGSVYYGPSQWGLRYGLSGW